eukprot:TRINITY_DN778029_c0_g1_i1.p1 TRINITY_DN778029_c0_g1~~TRINITY_DN778029_c0_g1_i1.p1  ORF type:complete len:168 (+),score=26.63 TRINITY_DN778029_c0_g1_i1:36-539(+)
MSMYDFPPFFTLQNGETRIKQLDQWQEIITAHFGANKKSCLVVNDFSLWENQKIKRKLSPDGVNAVMDHIVSNGYGVWEDDTKVRCKIMWKKPEEWADMIYAFAQDNEWSGNVFTVYEIYSGDDTRDEEFYGLDPQIILKSLSVLEEQGKCEIFSGETSEDAGVKFF